MEFEVGQPKSHRIDHLLSGNRAQIAIKIFGPDLGTLRLLGEAVEETVSAVPGAVDLMVEPQVGVPQLQVQIRRPAAAALGLRASDLAKMVERIVVCIPRAIPCEVDFLSRTAF